MPIHRDDLKRLKKELSRDRVITLDTDDGNDLFARLELAERGVSSLETVIRWMREEERYKILSAADLVWLQGAEIALEVWRNAAGK